MINLTNFFTSSNMGFLIFIIGIIVLCIFFLLIGYFLGGKTYTTSKHVPFESGIDSFGSARLPFSIKFYLIAIFFVIFDIETVYLYAWVIIIRKVGWIGFTEISIYCIILMVSLLYIFSIGALDWSKKNFEKNIKND